MLVPVHVDLDCLGSDGQELARVESSRVESESIDSGQKEQQCAAAQRRQGAAKRQPRVGRLVITSE